jgi:hypothetical protein
VSAAHLSAKRPVARTYKRMTEHSSGTHSESTPDALEDDSRHYWPDVFMLWSYIGRIIMLLGAGFSVQCAKRRRDRRPTRPDYAWSKTRETWAGES